jgi:hypothetical protein
MARKSEKGFLEKMFGKAPLKKTLGRKPLTSMWKAMALEKKPARKAKAAGGRKRP